MKSVSRHVDSKPEVAFGRNLKDNKQKNLSSRFKDKRPSWIPDFDTH